MLPLCIILCHDYYIMLHLCNRGRENLKDFKQSDFTVDKDSSNRRYVYFSTDKLTKNHRGEKNDSARSQCGRMYETGDENCPVESFCEYVSHLHSNFDNFWQRPKKGAPGPGPGQGKSSSNDVEAKACDNLAQNMPWYDRQAVGKNTLGNKLKTISTEAKTSRIYTNHCLRATTITTLDEHGFEARHIMSVSGHKSESSLKHYSRVPEGHKRKMSLCLAEKCHSKSNSAKKAIASPSLEPREAMPTAKHSRKASPGLVPNLPLVHVPRPRPPCTLSRPPPSPPVCGPKAKSNAGSTIKPRATSPSTFTAHSPLSPSQRSIFPSSLTSFSSQDSQNKTGPASPNLQSSPQTMNFVSNKLDVDQKSVVQYHFHQCSVNITNNK